MPQMCMNWGTMKSDVSPRYDTATHPLRTTGLLPAASEDDRPDENFRMNIAELSSCHTTQFCIYMNIYIYEFLGWKGFEPSLVLMDCWEL